MEILIKRLSAQAKLPIYSREAGPGIDLYTVGEIVVAAGSKVIVSTGIAMAVPVGYVGLIWNKNSTVVGENIKVSTGIIDSGYREEVLVELVNIGNEEFRLGAGEKVAQILVQKIELAHLIEAEDLSGFGTEK